MRVFQSLSTKSVMVIDGTAINFSHVKRLDKSEEDSGVIFYYQLYATVDIHALAGAATDRAITASRLQKRVFCFLFCGHQIKTLEVLWRSSFAPYQKHFQIIIIVEMKTYSHNQISMQSLIIPCRREHTNKEVHEYTRFGTL